MSFNYARTGIYCAEDVRAVANAAGSHFFSPGAMRAFSSRLISGVWAPDGYETAPGSRFFFVTSEVHVDTTRHYAVRMMTLGQNDSGRVSVDIVTVGAYHNSADRAKREAQKLSDEIRYLDA